MTADRLAMLLSAAADRQGGIQSPEFDEIWDRYASARYRPLLFPQELPNVDDRRILAGVGHTRTGSGILDDINGVMT